MDSKPEEFTGIIKLISGDELIGKILVCEKENGFIVENPFLVKATLMSTPSGEMFKVDLIPWMKFAKTEIFFIEKEKVFTVSESDDRITRLYKSTLRKYLLGDEASNEVELTHQQGKRGSVEAARTKLEMLFNRS